MYNPSYLESVEELAIKAQRFNVCTSSNPIALSPNDYKKVCNSMIVPLIGYCLEIRVFGQKKEDELVSKNSDIFEYKGNGTYIKVDGSSVLGHESYWGADKGGRGTIVMVLECEPEKLGDVLSKSYNPGFIANVAGVSGRSAVKFALDSIVEERRIAILLSANRGMAELYLHVKAAMIPDLLKLAFERCQYTDSFRNMYKL